MTDAQATSAGGPGKPAAPDGEILAMLARGDGSAFDEIVKAHHGHVAVLANRLTGWPGDVEDVVQEVFLSALRNLKSFRGQSSISTWLTAITINHCRSRHRRLRAAKALLAGWLQMPRRTTVAAEGTLAADERLDRVRAAMARLKRPLREVIVLKYLQEMSTLQVAEALGLSVGAVDVRLHRARARLKEMLADLNEDDA